jgi:hypothetical protein
MLIGKKTDHRQIYNVGRLASEALLDSMIVGYGVKYMTARERPLENDS